MDNPVLHIEKRRYNPALPVWCVMDGETVLQCFLTEQEATEEQRKVAANAANKEKT